VSWCGWVSGFHRDTVAAVDTWVVSLVVVVGVDVALWRGRRGLDWGWHLEPVSTPWPREGRGGSRSALSGLGPWLVLFVAALTWDVLGLDSGPHQFHLTISALSQSYRALNAALLLVWLLVGIGYGVTRARTAWPVVGDDTAPRHADPGPGSPSALGAGITAGGGHRTLPTLLLPEHPWVGVAFWVAVPLAAVAIDQFARRSSGRLATAEEALRFVSTGTATKLLLVGAWTFAGYHLFAR
jgi:hypothetical protein